MTTLPTEAQTPGADVQAITAEVNQQVTTANRIADAVGARVIGQEAMVEGLLVGLLTNGHVLLEGVPGLAKTLTISTVAQAIDAPFARLQFTPDLLPADLIGTLIYNPRDGVFEPKKGPIFASLVLADEINRAPAKVQSALLEAMQERQVTIGDQTYPLPEPFLVMATQNPVEQEGTYPLPEAQVDRFMLKLTVGYPGKADERRVLDLMASTEKPEPISPVATLTDIIAARHTVNRIYVDTKIRDYVVELVHATRNPTEVGLDGLDRLIDFGASPRATIALTLAGKARAFLAGRGFVTPQDVKGIAAEVLRHRVIPSYEAEAEGMSADEIVQRVLDHVPVP
ncbi:MAG: MoxR family ATPase [Planctomycetota bacterium]